MLLIRRGSLRLFGRFNRSTRGVRGGVAVRDELLAVAWGALSAVRRGVRVRRWLRAGRRDRVFALFLGFFRADVVSITIGVIDDLSALLRDRAGRVRARAPVRTCLVRHSQPGLHSPNFSPDAFCDFVSALVPFVLGQDLRAFRRRHVWRRVGHLVRDHLQIS